MKDLYILKKLISLSFHEMYITVPKEDRGTGSFFLSFRIVNKCLRPKKYQMG